MKSGHFPHYAFDLTRAMKREFIDSKFLNDDDIYIDFTDICNAGDVFKVRLKKTPKPPSSQR